MKRCVEKVNRNIAQNNFYSSVLKFGVCLLKKSDFAIGETFGMGIFILLGSSVGVTAFSNYNSILIGDLAAGMGGAASALVGDTSSAAFYNPATLAQVDGSSFSAAVGIYKKFDTVYGKEEDFTQAPLRVNQGFFRSLPASTGNMIRVDDWALGMSIVVPDYDNFKGEINNSVTNITTLSIVDESLWVGGAAAKELNDKASIGLTAYYTARTYTKSVNDRSFPDSTSAKLFTSEKDIKENAIVFVLGYYHKFTEKWSFGISLRPPSLRVSGQGSYNEGYTEVNSGVYTPTPAKNFTGMSTTPHIPARLSMGVHWQAHSKIRVTSDVSFYEGFSYSDVDEPQAEVVYQHRPIINAAFGGELEILEWLKVRAGGFTNFSSHPEPNELSSNREQPDRVDQVGFSANAVFYAGRTMSYTFGGYYSGGRGKSVQRVDQKNTLMVKNQHVFTMLVGSSFYF